jgi:hypothetical protein
MMIWGRLKDFVWWAAMSLFLKSFKDEKEIDEFIEYLIEKENGSRPKYRNEEP